MFNLIALGVIFFIFITNLFSLNFLVFDSLLPVEKKHKYHLKETSLLRKFIPFKEKKHEYYGPTFLKTSVYPYIISLFVFVLTFPILLFNFFFEFIDDIVIKIATHIIFFCYIVRALIIRILSLLP